jgi:hypothetical protein
MRDQLILILRDARSVQIGTDCTRVKELAESIEVKAMAALHGGKTIIPSELFGEITIPKDIITAMSNGEDDMWFSHGCALDVNVFYVSVEDGWQFNIYPVKNGDTDTGHLLEHGKL